MWSRRGDVSRRPVPGWVRRDSARQAAWLLRYQTVEAAPSPYTADEVADGHPAGDCGLVEARLLCGFFCGCGPGVERGAEEVEVEEIACAGTLCEEFEFGGEL